jgi:glycosyltransferase involved in cell wall biosynthesis
MDARRILLAHDWLTGMRGGEKCLEPLARRWPSARLYTLLHRRGSVSAAIENLDVHTSLLHQLPFSHRLYRYFLPLMPTVVGSWKLPPSELLVSFSHCVVKGLKPACGKHVCYCFTPMRYAWHMREAYFAGRVRGLKARLVDRLLAQLREWDRRTAAHVDQFIAISHTVQRRIKECYGRDSFVIYPPVDTDFYSPAEVRREGFYLVVSAFAPYKRIDLAIEACSRLGKRLVVIGSGQDEARVRKQTTGDVQFLGWRPDAEIRDHLRRCKALIFPGFEDFGIVPVEAMACGTPVIALGKGGAAETVVPHYAGDEATGVWFAEQTPECLADAIEAFERHADVFDPRVLRRQALRFSTANYEANLFAALDAVLAGRDPSLGRMAA